MPGYFSYFPNVYVGEGVSDNEAFKYRLVKNIFRKITARRDLSQYTTLFEAYSIRPGETPSTLATRLFDDAFLDWTILLINDITDVYEEWPRESEALEEFVNEKYHANADAIHHWETNEVLLDDGTVFVKQGIEVTEDWRTVLPDGSTMSKEDSIYPVTNYEHEDYLNEVKRQILIPVSNMVDIMIEEVEDILAYEPHAELDDANNKKTVLNLTSRFLNNVGSVSFASAVQTRPTNGTGVTFDNGPAAGSVGVSGTGTTTITTTTTSTITGATTTTTSPSPSPSPSSSSPSSSPSSGSGGSGGSGGY